jgi:hypothetical protein
VSENLIESVAPQLAAPVTREPVQAAAESGEGTTVAIVAMPCLPMFADDDAE